MGGGVGVGNRSAVAEYNILCDRACIVLSCALLNSSKIATISGSCSNRARRARSQGGGPTRCDFYRDMLNVRVVP